MRKRQLSRLKIFLNMYPYNLLELDTAAPNEPDARILIIYTGGTFGMGVDKHGSLKPFDFSEILHEIPSLKSFNLIIKVLEFVKPVDSSDINPGHWIEMGQIIKRFYDSFDGFVILHGTDTMAYSASALSFILENLTKPVIFTGAQLPVTAPRTDAGDNFVTAIEIASERNESEKPVVSEVCIYFNHHLIRGNRAQKVESMHFDVFESVNYPPLAKAGVEIDYKYQFIKSFGREGTLGVADKLDDNVTFLKLFPGISENVVKSILKNPDLKGVVLETFGSGNAPMEHWFLSAVSEAVGNGLLIYNVSQCLGGKVIQGRYETSMALKDAGVISGKDITSEAAITKMMYLLGMEKRMDSIRNKLKLSLKGELSE